MYGDKIDRISEEKLKRNGFQRVNYMNAFTRSRGGSMIVVSYGLIVAIGHCSADGYHNYSPTTSKQVSRATGTYSGERKKEWDIVPESEFIAMANDILATLR